MQLYSTHYTTHTLGCTKPILNVSKVFCHFGISVNERMVSVLSRMAFQTFGTYLISLIHPTLAQYYSLHKSSQAKIEIAREGYFDKILKSISTKNIYK